MLFTCGRYEGYEYNIKSVTLIKHLVNVIFVGYFYSHILLYDVEGNLYM
jgi:hypothetical protein